MHTGLVCWSSVFIMECTKFFWCLAVRQFNNVRNSSPRVINIVDKNSQLWIKLSIGITLLGVSMRISISNKTFLQHTITSTVRCLSSIKSFPRVSSFWYLIWLYLYSKIFFCSGKICFITILLNCLDVADRKCLDIYMIFAMEYLNIIILYRIWLKYIRGSMF